MIDGKRIMFVDGENLVFRYQEMLKEGKQPKAGIIHEPDVFVWNSAITKSGFMNLLRVGYYTSAVGDDTKLSDLRLAISQIKAPYTTVMDDGLTDLVPFIFKKDRQARKTRLVDIHICIDVMRYAYIDSIECVHLISGDADYVPLISDVMRRGKKVIVWALSSGANMQLKTVPDEFRIMDNLLFETGGG